MNKMKKTTTPGPDAMDPGVCSPDLEPDARDHDVCSPDLDQTPRTLSFRSLYIIFDMLFDAGR